MADTTITASLDDPKVQDGFRALVEETIAGDEALEADFYVQFFDRFRKENPDFAKTQPDLFRQYDGWYWQMKWVGLPHQTTRELPELFEKKLDVAWQLPDFRFWDKLRDKLTRLDFEERDPIKKQILQALERSVITLTATPPKTAGGWVKELLFAVGPPPADSLKLSQYVSSNKNFLSLSPLDQEKMRRLFNAVERLRLSTFTPEGFEEGELSVSFDGRAGKLKGRTFVEADPELLRIARVIREGRVTAKPEDTKKEALRAYEGDPDTAKKIEQAMAKHRINLGTDEQKIADAFRKVLTAPGRPDLIETTSLLLYAASSGSLRGLLRRGQWITEVFATQEGAKQHPELLEAFKLTPDAPPSVAFFIRTVISGIVGASMAESARIGMRVANLLRAQNDAQYLDMVQYNPEARQFEWRLGV